MVILGISLLEHGSSSLCLLHSYSISLGETLINSELLQQPPTAFLPLDTSILMPT